MAIPSGPAKNPAKPLLLGVDVERAGSRGRDPQVAVPHQAGHEPQCRNPESQWGPGLHWTVQQFYGTGGMATVYLAEDLKHHRKVAVQVLRPELAAVLVAEAGWRRSSPPTDGYLVTAARGAT